MRPLRGRLVVREHKEVSGMILMPGGDPRLTTTHRGTVVAAGPPVRRDDGVEIPLGFGVGDVVQFHFSANEAGRTVYGDLVVMAQHEIDAVIE